MTPEERARYAFEFFLRHGWVKERDRKAVTDGIECAIRAAEQEAAAREREACAKDVLCQKISAFNTTDPWNASLDQAAARIRARK